MSAIVPWTDPGGTPCCCAPPCPNTFNADFWGAVSQTNAVFSSITTEQAIALFAGGSVTVEISGTLSVAYTGGSLFTGSVSVSGTRVIQNVGGCFANMSAQINSSISGATATANAVVAPIGANTRPTGSKTDTSASTTATLSYQIVQNEDTYGIYLGLATVVSTGLIQIPQSGGVVWQGGSSSTSAMTFTGGSGSATATFLGITLSSTGYAYQVENNYGATTFVSGSRSVTASFDLILEAP